MKESPRNGTRAAPDAPPWLKALLPQHRADLEASGLTAETIEAHGLASVESPGIVKRLLGWEPGGRCSLGPCLLIPFRRPDGSPIAPGEFCRLKPDRPRKRKGKGDSLVKYEQPAGKELHAYFPLGTVAALKDPTRPLLVTEGEKKSLAADQAGFACAGLTGVDCWQQDREMIADLAAVAWEGRTAYVVYDSDAAEKYDVRRAEWQLSQALKKRGASVKIVRLPPGPPGADGKPAKQGVDDFLKAAGPDALRSLLAEARDPVKPEKPPPIDRAKLQPLEAEDDPHRLARLFLDPDAKSGPVPPERLKLRHWREEWLQWDGAAYREIPGKEVRARLAGAVKREFDRLNLEALAKYQEWKAGGGKGDKDEGPPLARKVSVKLLGDV